MQLQTLFGSAWATIDEAGAVTAFGFGENKDAAGDAPEVARQVAEYFEGLRHAFMLPLAPKGTPFQLRVWCELAKIPAGQTITYTELGRRVGKENAPRAAGRANALNPIPLLIPCHRVVGSKGELTGYAYGVEMKKKLLDFERMAVARRAETES